MLSCKISVEGHVDIFEELKNIVATPCMLSLEDFRDFFFLSAAQLRFAHFLLGAELLRCTLSGVECL